MISLSIEGSHQLPKDLVTLPFYRSILRVARAVTPDWRAIDIRVILADDATVRSLNTSYRGINRVTDILSFNIPPITPADREVGELYIAIGQTVRQAHRYQTPLASELERLVIHGILHLQGYDHIKKRERLAMRALERKIKRELYA